MMAAFMMAGTGVLPVVWIIVFAGFPNALQAMDCGENATNVMAALCLAAAVCY